MVIHLNVNFQMVSIPIYIAGDNDQKKSCMVVLGGHVNFYLKYFCSIMQLFLGHCQLLLQHISPSSDIFNYLRLTPQSKLVHMKFYLHTHAFCTSTEMGVLGFVRYTLLVLGCVHRLSYILCMPTSPTCKLSSTVTYAQKLLIWTTFSYLATSNILILLSAYSLCFLSLCADILCNGLMPFLLHWVSLKISLFQSSDSYVVNFCTFFSISVADNEGTEFVFAFGSNYVNTGGVLEVFVTTRMDNLVHFNYTQGNITAVSALI